MTKYVQSSAAELSYEGRKFKMSDTVLSLCDSENICIKLQHVTSLKHGFGLITMAMLVYLTLDVEKEIPKEYFLTSLFHRSLTFL